MSFRRPVRALVLAAALLAAMLVSPVMPVGSSSAAEPERALTNPTGWWWYTGVDEAFLTDKVRANDARIIDLEVTSTSPLKFTAALVSNTGVHAKGWWWYFGLSEKGVKNKLAEHSARILDLETYKSGGKRRFAVVLVPNTGDAAKAWWWYYNAKPSFVSNKLSAKKARLIDLDTYVVNGKRRYAVVMVKNTGSDAKKWWWYYNVSPNFVKNKLKKKKARLVDIERPSPGKLTVVMERRSGEHWWWYYGKKKKQIAEAAAQNGARIFDIERYKVNGKTRFAALMLNNLNALSTKARKLLKEGAKKAAYGFYIKEVGGPTYAGLQTTKVFEPASTIKVVHLLTAMRAVQAGTASLTEDITWFVRPTDSARYPGQGDYADDKNRCAYDSDGAAITSNPYTDDLGPVILKQMMEQSDNRTTDATLNRFGFTAVNATATNLVGMTKTKINHRIGCPRKASPSPYQSNELTLFDAGLLYEGVADGTFLGTGTFRDTFYDYMLNGTGGWKAVVDEEAAKLGLAQSVADDFLAAMETAVKGGSYTTTVDCPSGVSGVCQVLRRTGFGVLSLPFKSSMTAAPFLRHYVFGSFVDGEFTCGNNCTGEVDKIGEARTAAQQAIVRPRIRKALETW